ncbi:ArnT family glycosyltransferase [Methylobacillus flagellatus]|uniref:Glycosyl transferase, family 39 n=1 Tax=Methylobacillus flagellatus (strain ATCC 51484 / DSM 6875 / VKM B-1610 / KT) TaxID=265072 RepID=Q1GYX8_METFK|nr:glycosyl transferase [Methylobacillus flagellatus]ABE50559.1 glycosyl transferase, family 39 [Methylobacillus flagellatus KT]
MAFELEHDWQAHLATPRARVGERAKTHLLILLCIAWIFLGLIGHEPWKPDEAQTISIVKNMTEGKGLLAPIAAGQQSIEYPPLYYWSAAGSGKLLSTILPLHDAARLINSVWMAITLLMVGMLGRELWGVGIGRQITFVFIASIGLVASSHLLMPQVASLAGLSMTLYALALAKRRPIRASALLGSGIGISFLATGLASALIPIATMLLLPILFSQWRSKSFAVVAALSLLVASPWLSIWPWLLYSTDPMQFHTWWHNSLSGSGTVTYPYILRTLLWYSWPALPIAAWGAWRYRAVLFIKPKMQLLLVFFVVSIIIIGVAFERREIHILPILLPLAALAGGSIETLKRGAAGALDWFGLLLFGLLGALIWLGWFAMLTGVPAKIAERMQFLAATQEAHLNILALAAALTVTIIWLFVVSNSQRSNRGALTNWAVGMTMAWGLLMTLWLPWIDNARGYKHVFEALNEAMPAQYACINSYGVGAAQTALLDYYTGLTIQPQRAPRSHHPACDLYLVQEDSRHVTLTPGDDWQLIWSGNRALDRRESFRLFMRRPSSSAED